MIFPQGLSLSLKISLGLQVPDFRRKVLAVFRNIQRKTQLVILPSNRVACRQSEKNYEFQTSKPMRRFERIVALTITVLVIYRVFIGIEVSVFLRVMMTLLSIFYMWFGFFLFNEAQITDLFHKKTRARFTGFKIASSIMMGLVYSTALIALMRGLYFYAGMNFMLGFSFFLILFSLSFTLVYNYLNREEQKYINKFYVRSLIFGGILAIALLTPVEKRINMLYGAYPSFVEAYMEYRQNPEDPTALERLREERSRFR